MTSAFPDYRRIIIIGSGGAGKSTLARQLGSITGTPVIHLDAIYWRPGWQPVGEEEFDARLSAELKKERWIIDGNFGRTLAQRARRSDLVIYLDYSSVVCLCGVIGRRIKYRGRTREDMTEGCEEKLDWEFLKWVVSFKKTKKPEILATLEQEQEAGARFELVIFRNRRQAKRWLKERRESVRGNG